MNPPHDTNDTYNDGVRLKEPIVQVLHKLWLVLGKWMRSPLYATK